GTSGRAGFWLPSSGQASTTSPYKAGPSPLRPGVRSVTMRRLAIRPSTSRIPQSPGPSFAKSAALSSGIVVVARAGADPDLLDVWLRSRLATLLLPVAVAPLPGRPWWWGTVNPCAGILLLLFSFCSVLSVASFFGLA